MKKMLASVLVGLCLASVVWAGSPTTVSVHKQGGLLVIRAKGTTTGASGADTVYVDISKADWGISSSNAYQLDFGVYNASTAGDSVTVTIGQAFAAAVGTASGSVSIGPINGADDGAASAALTQIAPLLFFKIADSDVTSATVTYDVYLYTKAIN